MSQHLLYSCITSVHWRAVDPHHRPHRHFTDVMCNIYASFLTLPFFHFHLVKNSRTSTERETFVCGCDCLMHWTNPWFPKETYHCDLNKVQICLAFCTGQFLDEKAVQSLQFKISLKSLPHSIVEWGAENLLLVYCIYAQHWISYQLKWSRKE